MGPFQVGLMLGLSIIVAIGAQNMFLIRQGVLNQHPYFSVFICFLCDTALMILGVLGLGIVIIKVPVVQHVILVGATLFLLIYGGGCFYRALSAQDHGVDNTGKQAVSQRKVLILALTFSLLNPQAIIDAMIVVGGSANQYQAVDKYYFLLGAISASLFWFVSLVMLAKKYSTYLLKPKVWQCLEFVSGVLMWSVLLLLVKKLA